MFNYRKMDEKDLHYIVVGDASDVTEDEPLFLDIDDKPVAVISYEGELYALLDACSHDGEILADGDIEDGEIICPRHGARFSLATGKALTPPAVKDIPVYPVRVREKQLEIGLPISKGDAS